MKWSERLEKIRMRANQNVTDSNEYWNVTLCQEDRKFLLEYIDFLLSMRKDEQNIFESMGV
jgi:hypothetical protein